jgi:hypothetical protein
MKKKLLASLVLLAGLGSYGNAMAIVDLTTADLNLSGTAQSIGDVIRLTEAKDWATGTAFSSKSVNLSNFSAAFQYQFSDTGQWGTADGIAFVIKNADSVAGANGGGMGYMGTPNSVAVEFDTWYNTEDLYNDKSANHIAIDVNGSMKSFSELDVSPQFNGSGTWYAWVDYQNGVLTASTGQSSDKSDAVTISKAVDIPNIVGSSTGLVGFTASTGAASQNQDISAFQYSSNPAPVPEPSTYVLMGIGGVLAAARLRKSRLVQI